MPIEASRRLGLKHVIQLAAPIINTLLLLVFVIWVLGARDSRDAIESLGELAQQRTGTDVVQAIQRLSPTAIVLTLAIGLAVFTASMIFIGLFFGRRASRSLKAWLLFSFLVCGWLAASLGWTNVYWYGQSLRISAEVAAAEEIATELLLDWPEGDGDVPTLGVVLGYPKEDTITLILAGKPVAVGNLRISAVERSDDRETLRFQLAGADRDAWLVRTPNAETPRDFINGFGTRYAAKKSRRLSQRWHLVRFEPT